MTTPTTATITIVLPQVPEELSGEITSLGNALIHQVHEQHAIQAIMTVVIDESEEKDA